MNVSKLFTLEEKDKNNQKTSSELIAQIPLQLRNFMCSDQKLHFNKTDFVDRYVVICSEIPAAEERFNIIAQNASICYFFPF